MAPHATEAFWCKCPPKALDGLGVGVVGDGIVRGMSGPVVFEAERPGYVRGSARPLWRASGGPIHGKQSP